MEIARIVCMQCGHVIRDFRLDSGLVSHGLCNDCAAEFARQIEALEPAEDTAWPALAAVASAR